MAKETKSAPATVELTIEQQRELLTKRYAALGAAGIRLSAEKAWLRPAVEGAVNAKVNKAVAALTDEQVSVVLAFANAAL